MRVLAVTTMRNEAPFILEWVAYHRHIGVTDFLVFSNDCDDGTDKLLDRLQALGVLQHERNHAGGKKTVQWRALGKANRHPLVTNADWIFVTDVDEFLCIHAGDGKITDLIAACPDADGFAIPWRMFGNAGVVNFSDAPILDQFTKAAPDALLWPWRAVQFKSLYRQNLRYQRLGIHRPQLKEGEPPSRWYDGNGALQPAVPGTVVPTLLPRYALAQINHYALGAMESFLVKVERGRPNHSKDPIDLAYWVDRNFNTIEDLRILRHRDAVTAQVSELRADPQIDALHCAGVVWRQERIAWLKEQSDYFYLLARIMQMGSTEVLPQMHQKILFQGLMTVRQRQAEAKTDS